MTPITIVVFGSSIRDKTPPGQNGSLLGLSFGFPGHLVEDFVDGLSTE